MSFANLCGIHDGARQAALERTSRLIQASGVEQVRFSWCDLHGMLRGKTLVAATAAKAMMSGVGMVSTLMLKDTSDRTAYKVFEAGGVADLPGFECASNLLLLADPASYQQLPWTPQTGWVQCQPWFSDGTPVALDTRRILQAALKRLADQGMGLQCGLEVEFHIYRITEGGRTEQLDPALATWPGLPPQVAMIHPGYRLLSEELADLCDEPLRIVRQTAQALGMPLLSTEIELGPSQVEAVFDVTDALTAADTMVLFRSAVAQALRRAGYHASFMCRPPFPNVMSSGWHLHQSLVNLDFGRNLFMRDAPAPGSTPSDAEFTLSELGEHYLAGLLDHARGMAVLTTPTINGFERFRPNALAPQSILWGRDNRGAMLRVIGQAGDAATRIENRIGESAANPYLYMASQIHAGLDGIVRQLKAPPASDSPYSDTNARLPASMGEALAAFQQNSAMTDGFGADFINYFCRIKQAELQRWSQADDKMDWQRREYFSRF